MPLCLPLPWMEMNEYLLDIGKERNPGDLCVKAFHKLESCLPFDIGILIILDDNLKPAQRFFKGMDATLSDEYLEYYSKIEDGRHSYLTTTPEFIDWRSMNDCEFKQNFIGPQRIWHSAYMKFYSADRWLKAAIAINRTNKSGFDQTEREMLRIIRSHLSNLHTNLYVSVSGIVNHPSDRNLRKPLTRRESEIVDLLLKGMSPKAIGIRKHLSPRTVYNHLAHIFEKAGVSNQRELLIRFMDKNSNMGNLS